MDNADELVELRRAQMELLERAEETYLLLMRSRRRLAVFALVMTLIFGAAAVQFTVRYLDARRAAEVIEDRVLFDAFGITIPDPEPAILRIELRARASINGFLAAACAGIAALWLLGAAMAAPPRRGRADPTGRDSPARAAPVARLR
ncbi:MAG TPA: hypothetical protein VML96_05925 [Egibacteraceae bacterium]|nr:hypothetical protein [Egibacteraceae bacterium]